MALIPAPRHASGRSGQRLVRVLIVVALVYVFPAIAPASASPVKIIAHDAIALPGQRLFLEASLYRSGVRGMLSPPVGGEVLRFYTKDGELLGEKLTDVAGTARIAYEERGPGVYPFTVRLWDNQRYEAESGEAIVVVRNPTNRLFFVAVEETLAGTSAVEFLIRPQEKILPVPDANTILSGLPRQYDIVYLTGVKRTSLDKMRQWLKTHDFPKAPLWPVAGALLKGEEGDEKAFTEAIDRIWKDRRFPAHVVLTRKSLAQAVAEKKVKVFLLDLAHRDSKEETHTCDCKDVCRVQGWEEIGPCIRHERN